jgi:hypothetical protein
MAEPEHRLLANAVGTILSRVDVPGVGLSLKFSLRQHYILSKFSIVTEASIAIPGEPRLSASEDAPGM